MDAIYNFPKSEPLNFKDFFESYLEELNKTKFPQSDKDIQSLIGLDDNDEEFANIKASVSLDFLEHVKDRRVESFTTGWSKIRRFLKETTEMETELHSLRKFSQHTSRNSLFSRNQYKYLQKLTVTNQADHDLLPYSDIIVAVRIYRPREKTLQKRRKKPTFNEEFLCLGSNTLAQLRDKISCICNEKRFFDLSENILEENKLKDTDPGFFFIEDTFYNDMRNPLNPDYSEVIREWISKKPKGYENVNFKTKLMEETRIIDLTVSLGFPQVYQHHGKCEHLMAFSHVELLSRHHCLVKDQYPVLKSLNKYNTKCCNMCGKRVFTHVVINSNRQLHEPAYLCSICLISFHYVDGKKVGDFNVYRITSYNEKIDAHEMPVLENIKNLGQPADVDELDVDGEMDYLSS